MAPSPLHAETMALLLAIQLVEQCEVNFLEDYLAMAWVAASKRITDTHVPKELREQIAQYRKDSTNLQPRIYHIKETSMECLTTMLIRQSDNLSMCLSLVALIRFMCKAISLKC
jgi:hypothetical protein